VGEIQSEAELLPSARALLADIAPGHGMAEEVESPWGIPDLVAWTQFKPTGNPLGRKSLQILSAVRREGPTPLSRLSERLGLTGITLERLLKVPIERGMVSMEDGVVSVYSVPRSSIGLTAVEMKLRDWKSGLKQAIRYKTFADRVYVFLGYVPSTLDLAAFAGEKIGIAELQPSPRVLLDAGPVADENVEAARVLVREAISRKLNPH